MSEKQYTPMQRKAVYEEGKNILVSASAGSGKTYVMIERVIRLILEGKAEVGEILAVTYTSAAAEEMKQKLVKAVVSEINAGKDCDRLRKTLADIPTASISTFHSFCSNLIRAYFYALPVDPAFTICDDAKSDELESKAIDGLFSDLYESRDEDFLYLVGILRKGRSDSALKELVKGLYTFARSEKSAEDFLNAAAVNVTEKSFYKAENELFVIYRSYFEELKRICENLLSSAEDLNEEKLGGHISTLLAKTDFCLSAKSYRDLIRAATLSVDKTPAVKSDDESVNELKDRIKTLKMRLKSVCDDLVATTPNGDEKTDLEDYLATARATSAICRLTIMFGERYAEEKTDEVCLDFSDLENFAYRLLSENPDVLSAVRNKYKYVFADEYQDVNGIQEAILSLIACDNAFMVGDVKQSIYAFRGCNPDIFANKYAAYEHGDGIPVSLDVNFRSSDAVLSAVNNTFSPVMTRNFGGTDYAANPMSGYGGYPVGYGKTVLHEVSVTKKAKNLQTGVYDLVNAAEDTDVSDAFAEGDAVAKIIEEELNDEIFDAKTGLKRKVGLKDIAVLTRNSSGFTSEIVRRLKRYGIPVASSAKNPIRDYPEIKLLYDFLRLIDYFADDAPLIACLKSAIGGLDEEDIAEIRRSAPEKTNNKKPTFVECYLRYIADGEDETLKNKLTAFDEYISKIRLLAEFESAGEILSRVLAETGLDLEILSRIDGKTRLKRVERFIAESESGGECLTIGRFLSRIENSLEDISVGSSDGDDSVTVMSMHSSKGLEFPVVILAGLSKRFNIDDLKKEIMVDRADGIALKLYDETDRTVKSTLVRAAFRERAKLNLIKEELRIFYVAMTRAKDRLHLVTTETVEKNDRFSSALFANKFSNFIKSSYFDETVAFEEDVGTIGKEKRKVYLSADRPSLTDKIYEYLTFTYPYESDVTLPVKRAVTKLAEDFEEPSILSDTFAPYGENARERGIAYHAFLQYCDFSQKNAHEEIERLSKTKKLSAAQVSLLGEEKIGAILSAKIFKDLKGYKLYREQPFVVPLPASEVSKLKTDGNILVQGVIDLLAVRGDEAIIVDYKTSHKNADALKSTYAEQLALYKKAVEKTLKLKVVRLVLFNIMSAETIDL